MRLGRSSVNSALIFDTHWSAWPIPFRVRGCLRFCDVVVPGMGAGPGFSFSVGGPFGTLVPQALCEGSADLSLDNYSVLRVWGCWRSGKSCKYKGGGLNYSRKIVVI